MTAAADDLLAVARLLVDDPRSIEIEEVVAGDGAELRLRIAEAERGHVIGRRGRTIDALRSLARVRGDRDGRPLAVEIDEG
jgi:predicted RNA-binding protein YlqC (UPF0109 family)